MADDSISNKVKGTAKEVAGQVTGQDDLEREGRAQQEKSRESEKAEAKEAEAAEHRKKAQGHAGEEKSEQ
ncbi:CsbD family protein [Iamia majanohamensis]|uniref:CsbD family protein n=1 Tax=Iamia majanohamensis TaxID=467976 RepID=A0AAE9YBY6_9ACTN|nr:CsbD family protein [Iamia majanohamensis]WCO68234.1 CsbD family protein [Iamia majanohamensis]